MLTRIRVGALASALLLSVSSVALGAQPFDVKSFQQAQAAGKTILVDVSATWCPTCKAQKPIVQEIEQQNPQLVVFDVDFDTAENALRQFRVQHQSTLIVFKGGKEVGRSTGDTNRSSIKNLVQKGF